MAEANTFQLAQAVGGARIIVPSGARLPLTAAQVARATLVQQGLDLVIVQADGPPVLVRGYFASAERPDLQLADGRVLSHQAIESAIGLGPTPLADVAALPSSPLASQSGTRGAAGRGLGGSLRSLTDSSLDALLGDDPSNGGFDRGRSDRPELPPLEILSAAPLGSGPASFTGGQRLPTELLGTAQLASIAAANTVAGQNTQNVGNQNTGAGQATPGPSFSRAIVTADSGNPGDGKPNISALAEQGTSGNDTYDKTGIFSIQVNSDNGPPATTFMLTGNNGAQQFSVATVQANGNIVSFDAGDGVRMYDMGNLPGSLPSFVDFGTSGWFEPVADTFAGMAGNDSILGGRGQDLLLGDFDNLPGTRRLTSTSADEAPTGGIAGNDTIDGGSGSDTVFGGGGSDSLLGSAGDDLIIVPDLNFAMVNGGDGGSFVGTPFSSQFQTQPANVGNAIDILELAGSNLNLDFTNAALASRVTKFEAFDLGTNTANSFKATAAQIQAIGSESTGSNPGTQNAIFILGGNDANFPSLANNVMLSGGGWAQTGSGIAGNTLEINTTASLTFNLFTNGAVSVYVESTIALSNVALS